MDKNSELTTEELRQYAETHLAREVEMLRWSSSYLNGFSSARLSSHQPAGKIANALRAMALESFVIHSRNLIDFLYLGIAFGRRKPTDITIGDYLDEQAVADDLPDPTSAIRSAREKANKLVAHLTTERQTRGFYEKVWITSEIENDLLEALRRVIVEIPDKLRSSRLEHAISETLPPAFHLRILPHAEDDERGSGLAISFGRNYRPDLYQGHA